MSIPAPMKTVLVVDDDSDIRALISWKLSLSGFAIIGEADGEGALRAAAGESQNAPGVRPDLVLLDWTMPRMSGIEVCKALRSDPSTSDLPIILLTAKAQESEVAQGLAAGADDYIVKPFSPGELLRRVTALLTLAENRAS